MDLRVHAVARGGPAEKLAHTRDVIVLGAHAAPAHRPVEAERDGVTMVRDAHDVGGRKELGHLGRGMGRGPAGAGDGGRKEKREAGHTEENYTSAAAER